MTTSDINNATASQTVTDGGFTITNGVAELALPADMTDLEVGSLPEQVSYNSVVIKGNDLNNTITMNYRVTTSVTLRGGAGNDQLVGQRGNDTLDGGSGADTMRGGEGSDTYHVDDAGDVIIEVDQAPGYLSNYPGFDTVISALNYTLSDKNLEHLTLVGGATKGVGNEFRNELRAGTLAASLSGLDGDDLLVGGKGNDTLDGGDGNDVYVASAGSDLLVDKGATGLNTLGLLDSVDLRDVRFSRAGLDLVVQYNATPDAASPSATTVQNYFDEENPLVNARWRTVSGYTDNSLGFLVDVANTIALGDGDDVLQLERGNGIVLSGAGNDLISIFKNASVIAGAGNDTVDGHGEMGFIEGDEGNDSIWGASSLYGGAGDDYLGVVVNTRLADGGAGNNTYKLGDGARYLTIKSSDDTSVNTIRFQPGPNGLAARPEDIQISGQGETYIDLHQAGTSTYANVQMTAGQTWQVVFDNGVVWKAADLIALTHTATEGKDTLLGLSGNDTFSGKGGDDNISGGTGNDLLSGDDGNDTLSGNEGNDTLIGGAGNDTLFGGEGNDTFVVGRQGNDVIDSTLYASSQDLEVLQFTDGIKASDVSISVANEYSSDYADLTLTYQGGSVVLDNFVTERRTGASAQFKEFVFADGERWDQARLEALRFLGTNNNDVLVAPVSGGLVEGLDGDDVLIGKNGATTLRGGAGNDTLRGGAGDDTLVGGQGANLLDGGEGADVHDFLLTDGFQDTLRADSADAIVVSGLRATVSVGKLGATGDKQVLLSFKNASGNTGTITLLDAGQWDGLILNVGTMVYTGAQIMALATEPDNLILTGTNGSDGLTGKDGNDTLIGLDGDDTLTGLGGNDILTGGRGNDLIDASQGDDVLRYALGDGDDTVYMDPFANGILELDGPFLPADLSVEQQFDGVRLSFGALPGSITFLTEVGFGAPNVEIKLSAPAASDVRVNLKDLEFLAAIPFGAGAALTGLDGADTLTGGLGRDTLVGGAGADLLIGGSSGDVYRGGTGDDVITDRPGSSDSRRIRGRPVLLGGQDTYLFGRGDGVDTVIDTGNAANRDILQFDAGITLADIELVRRSAVGALDARGPSIATALPQLDYEIYRIKGTGDEIRFTADVAEASPGPEWLRFADGTVVEASQLLVGAAAPIGMNASGTAAAESLLGTNLADTLAGGLGNDTLNGASASDQYIFSVGDGVDLIQEAPQNAYSGDVDTLSLRGALNLDTLKFSRNIVAIDRFSPPTSPDGTSSHSLVYAYTDVIDLGAGAGQVQVSWLPDGSANITSNRVDQNLGVLEQIKLDNGQSLNGTELLQRVLAGGVSLRGTDYAASLSGSVGNDLVETGISDDTLSGWGGNDTLRGNGGNDVLTGGRGNDWLEGGAGADTLTFDRGDGADTAVIDDFDTLQLGARLSKADVLIGKVGEQVANAVVLQLGKGSTDSVTLAQAGSWNGLQVKLADGSVITGAEIMAEATKPYDLTLQGTTNADSLSGGAGNDTLSGLAGNDTLLGAEGLDVLIGGTGSDVLDGGAGADIYQYAVGDGADLIRADGLDTIALGAGLSKANVQIGKLGAKVSNAVVLGLGSNAADTITLDNAGNWAGLQLKFADGSTLSGADILASATKPDNLTLTGTTKADVLTGKDGNDTLNGLAGNDTLAGGKGNDSLIGGKGNDTYLFNRGDGQDVVNDNDSSLFNSDLLKLGGATSKQLWLTKSGSNLDIKILGTQDQVTVQNWFAGSSNRIEKITASDGKSLSASKVQALVNAMASFTPPADAASLPANAPAALTKLVASSWA